MISRRAFVGSSLAAPAILNGLTGRANAAVDWPTGLVRSICPFPAGTGADIKVRWYAKKLTEATGKSVIVENKPGANAVLARNGDRLKANSRRFSTPSWSGSS